MKHGEGKIIYIDGGVYVGHWHADAIIGEGKYTLSCGEGPRGGPSQVWLHECLLSYVY